MSKQEVEESIQQLKKQLAFKVEVVEQIEHMLEEKTQYVSEEYLTRRLEELHKEQSDLKTKLFVAESYRQVKQLEGGLLN